MELFQLGDDGSIDLNKVWIRTNPVFKEILERDRGSERDSQARKKLKAQRDFQVLRMMLHPDSEYYEFDEKDRWGKVLGILGMTRRDYEQDEQLVEAYKEYDKIVNSLATIRLYKAAKKSLDAKIKWLEDYNPDARDKQGKLLITPKQHSEAIEAMEKDLHNVKKYSEQLKAEINNKMATRQTLNVSHTENRKGVWNEGENNRFLDKPDMRRLN